MASTTTKLTIDKTQLKSLIGAGKIGDTIEILKKIVKYENQLTNQLIIIEFQFNNLSTEQRLDLITSSQKKISSNGIALSLLKLIDKIDFTKIVLNKSQKEIEKNEKIEVQFTLLTKSRNKRKIESILKNLIEFSEDYSLKVNKIRSGSLIIDFSISRKGYHKLLRAISSGILVKAIGCDIIRILVKQSPIQSDNLSYDLESIKDELHNLRRQSEMNTLENRELKALVLNISRRLNNIPQVPRYNPLESSDDFSLVPGSQHYPSLTRPEEDLQMVLERFRERLGEKKNKGKEIEGDDLAR